MRLLNRAPRCGFTLVELIVTLAVIAILAAIVTVGAPPLDRSTSQSAMRTTIAHARARALATGHPVEDSLTLRGTSQPFRAMPDGGVLADSILLHVLTDSALR